MDFLTFEVENLNKEWEMMEKEMVEEVQNRSLYMCIEANGEPVSYLIHSMKLSNLLSCSCICTANLTNEFTYSTTTCSNCLSKGELEYKIELKWRFGLVTISPFSWVAGQSGSKSFLPVVANTW
nr:hypothetical protein CFP56_25101 [Quercus suber]